jgi:hypothetical protein
MQARLGGDWDWIGERRAAMARRAHADVGAGFEKQARGQFGELDFYATKGEGSANTILLAPGEDKKWSDDRKCPQRQMHQGSVCTMIDCGLS